VLLHGTLKKLSQTLEVKRHKHDAIGWGVLRFCRERKLGHECMVLNYFAPSLMYDGKKIEVLI
jgi:hypothetical protein